MDASKYEAITVEVSKLQLKPGDTLVIRATKPLPQADHESLANALRYICPEGVKGVVLNAGIIVEVVSLEPNPDTAIPADGQPLAA